MDLTSYLLGKKASGGGGGGGDTPDLNDYFITKINKNTSSATGDYYQNLVKKTAPLELSSNVTSLTYCFYQNQVDEIQFDKEKFDTSNITNMFGMFNGSKVKKLDLSSFNTENVTDFQYMFQSCSELREVDISSFTFKSNAKTSYMFYNAFKVTKIDMSGTTTVPSGQNKLETFKTVGRDCLQSEGAYADGIPYVYVKNEAVQNYILSGTSNFRPSTWTTANVVVKGSE